MSKGKGALVNVAVKHKLNTGSSNESELVSITDVLGMMVWCKYFMEAQGYSIENYILYQDIKSTILLANNGRMELEKTASISRTDVLLSLISFPWGVSRSTTRARVKYGPM